MRDMDRVISSFMGALLFCAILVFNLVLNVSGNPEGDALHAFKTSVADPNNVLQSWNNTLINPCTWFHVTCNSDNSVTHVDLGNANLSGQLVAQLGLLPNLQYLELYSNNITGKIPDEFGNLTNLVSLDLYANRIFGSIPETLGKLQKLRFLRLNDNFLNGAIPMTLTTVYSLQVLDLSSNKLQGDIPTNGSFQLFTQLSFDNIPDMKPLSISPRLPSPSGKSATGAIAAGVGAAALLFTVSAIALACYYRKRIPIACCWKRRPSVTAKEVLKAHFSQIKKFALHELQVATDNFSNKNFLGSSGFGKVYKGRLTDGSLVAVKRLEEEGAQGGQFQFQTEIRLISMAVHRICFGCMVFA